MSLKGFHEVLENICRKRPWLLHAARIMSAVVYLGPWRHLIVRMLQITNKNHQVPVNKLNCFSALDSDYIAHSIDRYGYSMGIHLSGEYVDAVLRFYQALDAELLRNPHSKSKAILDIAHNHQIIEVVRKYFGAEPVFHSSVIYWSFPCLDSEGTPFRLRHQRFHYDVGDFRSLNVFIYLTNTDLDCGPHVVIEQTHKYKTPSQFVKHTLTDKEAHDKYGNRIKVIMGEKGTGFFEDTTCFHKQLINKKPRLILNLVYTMLRQPI